MTLDHNNSFDGTDCVENDDCEQSLMSQTTSSTQPGMLAYSSFSNREYSTFNGIHRPSLNTSFTSEPDCGSFCHSSGAIPQQYTYYPYSSRQQFSDDIPPLSYLPHSRLSLLTYPLCDTMEPQMMLKQESHSPGLDLPSLNTSFALPISTPSPDMMSAPSSSVSPQMHLNTPADQYYSQPMWHHNLPDFRIAAEDSQAASICDSLDDEEDNLYDKPYAQLIFECLIQAPRHRMLLRDIYEWFSLNTTKPRDSGTNGWQNSIRHNLSMNKAFENDKNDPCSKGARKANSVWFLTENAIKHGVQSTTRYRKTGTAKKSGNRIPAIQRQRSGAKGGRAARRAARMKRHEEGQRIPKAIQSEFGTPEAYARSPLSIAQDQWSTYGGYSPATPSDGHFFGSSYSLPQRICHEYDQDAQPKYEFEPFLDEHEQLRQMLSQPAAEDNLGDLSRL